ncbi:RNA polymerase sigma factor [Catenovulum sp. SM1970]|uniref:RNA polymerase sigma factor n=1 Tax=Marinifaba aquimaris TaxID=2741323 RepID=UPI001572D56B|nr:RNA polymerase sigma factor [Marinifaba aquimaris]NTS77210.1 RNA polymerase sigma factor [Marinifaba aquimaris]
MENLASKSLPEQADNLILQAQMGNRFAFSQVYQKHHGHVYALCLRLTANTTLAEDACQEVFIHLWHKLDSFDHQSKFSTWLHTVAVRVCISYLRKQKSWLQRVVQSEDQGITEAGLVEIHDLNGLDKLILKLPERARQVFVLVAVEGYRHEEVGQLLNIAVGSSKSQYHRAKGLLQQWWQQAGGQFDE